MHAVVMESLEEYLSGTLGLAADRDVEAHLSACERCREEVAGLRDISKLFVCLQPDLLPEATLEPAPGFHARVIQQIGERKAVPAFAGFFALDLAFGRRLAFASLLTFAILGSYLVMREGEYPTGLSPETVMAQQNSPAFLSASAQDNMLVTLTTYEP
jgi:anti-sigma factor RsiW